MLFLFTETIVDYTSDLEKICVQKLDLYQICTLYMLLYKCPLGFSAKIEVHGVDMRSYAADLQNDSEILNKIQVY